LGEHLINAGVAGRYTDTKSYGDFFFEPAAVWDITKDRNFIIAYNSVNFLGHFAAQPVPGWNNRFGSSLVAFGSVSGADGNISHSTQGSPFVQSSWKLADKLKFVAGARADFLHVFSSDPFDPKIADSIDVVLPSVNASFVYALAPTISTYVTYNYNRNTSGAPGNGGGLVAFAGPNAAGKFFLDKPAFEQPSELKEAGMKFSLLNSTLFIGSAIFDQTRTTTQQGGGTIEFQYRGIEIEANYQPNKNMYFTFSYPMLAASVPAKSITFEALNVSPAASREVRGNRQTGGRLKAQGLPRNQWNALYSYKLDSGFGFSVNGTLHDEINNNWAGTLVIPWQYQIDGSLFYNTKTWNYRISVLNATDEKNWAPPRYEYGNESILALAGITAELTVTYKF